MECWDGTGNFQTKSYNYFENTALVAIITCVTIGEGGEGGGGARAGCLTCAGGLGPHFLAHEGEQVLDGQGIGPVALHMGDGAIQALQAHQPPSCVVQAGHIPIQHQLLHQDNIMLLDIQINIDLPFLWKLFLV